MKVSDALKQRKSVRAFLEKLVEKEKIERILDAARWAPSGTNTQPWKVAVVSGEKKKQLDALMMDEFKELGKGHPAYNYYPQEWIDPFKGRRIACGKQLYSTMNIAREEKEKQKELWAANYRAFDASCAVYFFLDQVMETGSFMDYGMFIQSFMLMAEEEGLATCPQAALAEYPDVVRTFFDYEDNYRVICGLALGYEDKDALINSYRTAREEVGSFTQFFE